MPPWIERLWYGKSPWLPLWLPLEKLYLAVVRHRFQQRQKLQRPYKGAEVWIIGNLSVGGTGKTPMVLALIELAKASGRKVAVISRGYGGKSDSYPLSVEDNPDAACTGDEPLLIWQRSGCPVMVDPQRKRALDAVIERYQPDLVLSDDGLQHYALPRHRELVLVDGGRGFGNRHCLPAGPLREPLSRLTSVDQVIVNGRAGAARVPESTYWFDVVAGDIVSLDGKQRMPTGTWKQRVYAVAGLGNPRRFFTTLDEIGIEHEPLVFPDHHRFMASDFSGPVGRPILMTEKDAVKCRRLGLTDAWYLEVSACLEPSLQADIISALTHKELENG